MDDLDLGLDAETTALLDAHADGVAKREAKPKRADRFAPVRAALSTKSIIPMIDIGSDRNQSDRKRGECLYGYYQDGDATSLQAYIITGTNTYARALQKYRAALVQSLQDRGVSEGEPATASAEAVAIGEAYSKIASKAKKPTQATTTKGASKAAVEVVETPVPTPVPEPEPEPEKLYHNQAAALAAAAQMFGVNAKLGVDFNWINRGNQKRPRYALIAIKAGA